MMHNNCPGTCWDLCVFLTILMDEFMNRLEAIPIFLAFSLDTNKAYESLSNRSIVSSLKSFHLCFTSLRLWGVLTGFIHRGNTVTDHAAQPTILCYVPHKTTNSGLLSSNTRHLLVCVKLIGAKLWPLQSPLRSNEAIKRPFMRLSQCKDL